MGRKCGGPAVLVWRARGVSRGFGRECCWTWLAIPAEPGAHAPGWPSFAFSPFRAFAIHSKSAFGFPLSPLPSRGDKPHGSRVVRQRELPREPGADAFGSPRADLEFQICDFRLPASDSAQRNTPPRGDCDGVFGLAEVKLWKGKTLRSFRPPSPPTPLPRFGRRERPPSPRPLSRQAGEGRVSLHQSVYFRRRRQARPTRPKRPITASRPRLPGSGTRSNASAAAGTTISWPGPLVIR